MATVDLAAVDIGVQVSRVSLHLYPRNKPQAVHVLVTGQLYL